MQTVPPTPYSAWTNQQTAPKTPTLAEQSPLSNYFSYLIRRSVHTPQPAPRVAQPPAPTRKQATLTEAAKQFTANTPPGAAVFVGAIRAAFPKVQDNLWTAELKALGWTRGRMERENMPRRRIWRAPGALPRRRKAG